MAKIIDGKQVAQQIREELKREVAQLKQKYGVTPGLAAILVGENPASKVYVNMKAKACEETGIYSQKIHLPADTPQGKLIELIHGLNQDNRIHGILVQLPLPDHLDQHTVLYEVSPDKDVDGFHPINLGKLLSAKFWEELPTFVPCTPQGASSSSSPREPRSRASTLWSWGAASSWGSLWRCSCLPNKRRSRSPTRAQRISKRSVAKRIS
jgi:methylenetetrahydrofolate dehydrogenase (NADP+)/methenyltetrahydrofolate cyclohydrolase